MDNKNCDFAKFSFFDGMARGRVVAKIGKKLLLSDKI
jgi:hypothetical protein